MLAHDVSVGGRAYVFNSQINPQKTAAIVERAQVLNSKVKGDLNVNGDAKLVSSTVDGNLKMEDETCLSFCSIKTDKRISFVRDRILSHLEIEGEGTFGISEEISLKNIDFSKNK